MRVVVRLAGWDLALAINVGLVADEILLDLNYEEDFKAHVDFNVVMTNKSEFVEVQGTGEEKPFSKTTMQRILDTAESGIRSLLAIQQNVINEMGT